MCKLGLALSQGSNDQVTSMLGGYLVSRDCYVFDQTTLGRPITPRSLKHIIGRGHVEFSTNRQQDAHEFFLHLLAMIERGDHKEGLACVGDCFKFLVSGFYLSKLIRVDMMCGFYQSSLIRVDVWFLPVKPHQD